MSEIKVFISDDYYRAYLSVIFSEDDPVDIEQITNALKERNVIYGTDREVITAICHLKESVLDELVAEGQPHIHGIDSEITYLFKATHEAHPSISEDGTVDFKSLNILQKVKAGEVLATKTPATEGINGMTVTGKVINARNGKDKKFLLGENTILQEDGLAVIAACDGIYKSDNGKIIVQSILEFPDGVGINTGNVTFKGDIIVNGNVMSGYTIYCDGNLTVNGIVEDAFITATGDLTISKGISAHNESKISCGGNLVTKFIDNAEVRVYGNLEAGEILNSKVMCDGEVIVKGKKGHIVGGEITAKYAITATTIGSKMGVITLINLGVDIESLEELKAIKEYIKKEEDNEKKLKQFVSILSMKEVKGVITKEEKETLEKCVTSLKQTTYMIKEKTTRLNALRELLQKAQNGQIKTETIYPDTMVRIGKSTYFIDEAVLRSIIKKSDDEIIAIGF